MHKLPITVIILTKNEEVNLPYALRSVVKFAERIVVVDSNSTDNTRAIAAEYGEVFEHEFINQADQINWALDNIRIDTEWVLRLDADEEILPELWVEIKNVFSKVPSEVNGMIMKRRVIFMGRWMRHGGYYPAWFLRLWRNGKARSEERAVDEHMFLLEGKAIKLENDFLDNNRRGLAYWIEKQNDHSSREVLARTSKQKKELLARFFGSPAERRRWLKYNVFLVLPPFLRPFLLFIYRYVFRLGFLDGREGLIFFFNLSLWYNLLVDAKLLERQKAKK